MATKRKVKRFNGEDDSLALADENYGDNTTREERLAMVRGKPALDIRSRNEGVPKPERSLSDDMYSDYGPAAGRVSTETVTPTAPTPRAAPKAPIVTKEQLAASGLSLRDYLNKQQGLTRRGESAIDELRARPNENYGNEGRSRSTPPAAKNENYSNEGRSSKAPLRQVTQSELAESYVKKQAARRAAEAEARASERSKSPTSRPKASEQTFMGSLKFSKGGAVSASKRADGIAQRGKTRGKIC